MLNSNIHLLWSQLGRCFNIMGWACASSTFHWLYYHGPQIMVDSNRVHDCLLSVTAATMATHAWTKLGHMYGLSKSWVVKTCPLPEATSVTQSVGVVNNSHKLDLHMNWLQLLYNFCWVRLCLHSASNIHWHPCVSAGKCDWHHPVS